MSTVVGYLVGERAEFSGRRVAIPEKKLRGQRFEQAESRIVILRTARALGVKR